MPLVINTNVPALQARNAMDRASWNLNVSLRRLTTGSRINSAADDPSGSYYSSRLNSQISGTTVAYQNVQSAINMVTLAEGDLNTVNRQLERIKDLATQMSNGTQSTEQIAAIKKEAQERVDEINRITKESKLGDLKLLDGSLDDGAAATKGVRFQVGPNSDPTTNAIYAKDIFLNANTTGVKLFGTGAGEYADVAAAFADKDTAAKFIDIAQKSIDTVSKRVSNAGISVNRLISVADSLITKNENYAAAYSTVMDTDIALETANYTKYQILQQTAASLMAQANQLSGALALRLLPS